MVSLPVFETAVVPSILPLISVSAESVIVRVPALVIAAEVEVIL